MSERPCIGFGKFEDNCLNISRISPFLWCERCEALRRETIGAQMAAITEWFESES